MQWKYVDVVLLSAFFVLWSCCEHNFVSALAFAALGLSSCFLLMWSKTAAEIAVIAFSACVALLPQFNSISVMIFLLAVPAILGAGESIRISIVSGLLIWTAGNVDFAPGPEFGRLNSGDVVAAVLLAISIFVGKLISFLRRIAQRKSLELEVLQRFLNEDLAEKLHNSVASNLARITLELEQLSSSGNIVRADFESVFRELQAAEMSVRDLLDFRRGREANRRPKIALQELLEEVSTLLIRSGFHVELRFGKIPLEEVAVPGPASAIVRECAHNMQKYGDKAESVECVGTLENSRLRLYFRNAPKRGIENQLNSGVGLIIAHRLAESCKGKFASGLREDGRWLAELTVPVEVCT